MLESGVQYEAELQSNVMHKTYFKIRLARVAAFRTSHALPCRHASETTRQTSTFDR